MTQGEQHDVASERARQEAAERAAARRAWPGRRATLADERDELVQGTPAERIAMVWSMTLDAWALSGKPLPVYRREDMPGVVIRRWELREGG